jgi:hypothetical protein
MGPCPSANEDQVANGTLRGAREWLRIGHRRGGQQEELHGGCWSFVALSIAWGKVRLTAVECATQTRKQLEFITHTRCVVVLCHTSGGTNGALANSTTASHRSLPPGPSTLAFQPPGAGSPPGAGPLRRPPPARPQPASRARGRRRAASRRRLPRAAAGGGRRAGGVEASRNQRAPRGCAARGRRRRRAGAGGSMSKAGGGAAASTGIPGG